MHTPVSTRTCLESTADTFVQESQAKTAEAQAAWQGENAALQDTIKLQASEISALSTAREDADAGTAKLKTQLEGLQAALQAAQEQSEKDSVELKELQDLTQQAQVCSYGFMPSASSRILSQ